MGIRNPVLACYAARTEKEADEKASGLYTLWYGHQQDLETNLVIVEAKAPEEIGKGQKQWFVIWMGIVGGTLARMFANMAGGWDDHSIYQAIVLGMIVPSFVPSSMSFYELVIRV